MWRISTPGWRGKGGNGTEGGGIDALKTFSVFLINRYPPIHLAILFGKTRISLLGRIDLLRPFK